MLKLCLGGEKEGRRCIQFYGQCGIKIWVVVVCLTLLVLPGRLFFVSLVPC